MEDTKCNGCTLCCKLANISYMNSTHNNYCKMCDPNIGCKIHDTRPNKCKIFECAYTQMKKVKLELRPDKCGFMFEKITDNLMLASTDGNINNVPDLIMNQIKSFGSENISVVIQQFNPHKFLGFLVKGIDKNDIIKILEKKANDSA